MGKHTSFALVALAIVWMALAEDISWHALAMGLLIAMICFHFVAKFLPISEISGIAFFRLIFYPFWLLWQIILSGFYVARLVLTNSGKAGIVRVKARIKNTSLLMILTYSMSATPGTIVFETKDQEVRVLWLHHKTKYKNEAEVVDKMMKIPIEDKLLKVEKNHTEAEKLQS